MKLFNILIFLLFTLSDARPRTIFIGNSLLKRNCAPCIYRKIYRASSSGSIGTSSLLKGGSSLTYHLNQRNTWKILKRYPRSIVVLQEQSQLIQQPGYVETSLASFTRKRKRVYLVGTWAHKGNYYNVQFPLNSKFKKLSTKYGVTLAPVGQYWLYITLFSPELSLRLTTDGIHPSIEGTYLSSCIIYRSIFNRHVYLGRRPRSITRSNFKLLQYYCNVV